MQPVGELLQLGFEALRETLGDAALLLLTLRGVAVEFDLAGVVVDHALRADGQWPFLFDQAGVVGIELPVAPTAHDHVAVALFVEPGDVVLGGDTGIQHHRRRRLVRARRQRAHHLGQRLRLCGIAGENRAAFGKAARVQDQRQRHQRAVGALLLGFAEGGIGVCMGRALEVGIGQVVERDHLVEVEEVALAFVQEGFQCRLVRQQAVGDPVQRHQLQRGEIKIDQFPQRAALLQPVVGGQLAARRHHARDQRADGRGALRAVEAQRRQLPIQADLAQRRQGHMLHRHAARAHDLHCTDIDAVIIPRRTARIMATGTRPDDLRGIVLGGLLPTRIQVRHKQFRLPADQGLDALRQRRPLRLRHLEMAPEVEQRALAHPAAFADRLHQPIREIRLPAAPALDRGAADVHAHACCAGSRPRSIRWQTNMALHSAPKPQVSDFTDSSFRSVYFRSMA